MVDDNGQKPDLRKRDAAIQDANLQYQIEGGVKGGSLQRGFDPDEVEVLHQTAINLPPVRTIKALMGAAKGLGLGALGGTRPRETPGSLLTGSKMPTRQDLKDVIKDYYSRLTTSPKRSPVETKRAADIKSRIQKDEGVHSLGPRGLTGPRKRTSLQWGPGWEQTGELLGHPSDPEVRALMNEIIVAPERPVAEDILATEGPSFDRTYKNLLAARRRGTGHTVVAYKGEAGALQGDRYVIGHPGRKDSGWLGPGLYASSSPTSAKIYGENKRNLDEGASGVNILPVRLRMENPKTISWSRQREIGKSSPEDRANWLQTEVIDKGYDSVIVEYEHREAPGQPRIKDYFVVDESQIRSEFADFDPALADKPGLGKAHGGPIYASEILHMADGGPPKIPDLTSVPPNTEPANENMKQNRFWVEYLPVNDAYVALFGDDVGTASRIPLRHPDIPALGKKRNIATPMEQQYGAERWEQLPKEQTLFPTLEEIDSTLAKSNLWRDPETNTITGIENKPRPVDSSNLPALIAKTAALSLPDEPPPKGKGQRFRGIGSLMRRRLFPLIQAAQLGYEHLLSPEQKAEIKDFLASPAHEMVGMEKPGIEYFKDLLGMSGSETQGETINLPTDKGVGSLAKEARDMTSGPRSTDQAPSRAYPIAPRDEWYGDANYEMTGGRIEMMSPDEFLAKARPLEIDEVSRENIDDLKSHIESGRTLDPLSLNATGREDGRHRAHAARELGIEKVPVLVWSPTNKAHGGPIFKADGGLASMAPEARDMFREPRPMVKKPRLTALGPGANPGVASLCGVARNMNRSVVA